MKYSIVIPTYNHLDHLKKCVESVLRSTIKEINADQAELIIVCNGCTDGTVPWLFEEFSGRGFELGKQYQVLQYQEPMGYPGAVNAGIRASHGEYVVLMNNDCEVLSWGDNGLWLGILVAPFSDPLVAVTGPKKISAKDVGAPGRSFVVFFLAMIPRRVLDVVGLLDERFSPGAGEDIDFCFKAEALGYRCVSVPNDAVNPTATSYPLYHEGEVTVHSDVPDWESGFWERMNIVKSRLLHNYYKTADVLVDICTRGRYRTTLPLCIQSVLMQSVLPREVRVYCDDDPGFDIGKDPTYQRLRMLAETKGASIMFVPGSQQGQVRGHEAARKHALSAGIRYVWRIDDDDVAEPDVLARLLRLCHGGIIAAAGSVVDPASPGAGHKGDPTLDGLFGPNLQWSVGDGVVEADHLHSTFVYVAEKSPPYRGDLSIVGHREETFFTMDMRKNHRMVIDRGAVTWHLRGETGGIRSETDMALWEADEAKFREYLKSYQIVRVEPARIQKSRGKPVVRFNLNFGMGDHIMALRAFENISNSLLDKHCVLYVCHNVAFDKYWKRLADSQGISYEIKSVGDGIAELGQKGFDEISVYWWMIWHNWRGHVIDAMVKAYTEHIKKAETV